MTVDGILAKYGPCKRYNLNDAVSDYLEYIEEEPFYISPTLNNVKTDNRISTLNPKFVLLSAPGATGKSSLAKYVANKFGALYWDLSKIKLGTNSFVGSIVNAVGAAQYSNFIADLTAGKMLLVVDAFDEAEVISGRKMLGNFVKDISDSIYDHNVPCVFLLARTETAQYLASFCADNSIPVAHYEIGFFHETAAKSFITRKIVGRDAEPTPADIECVNAYYGVIQKNITPEEQLSFLGYAPVLEAISEHIRTSPNRAKMISVLSTQTECVSIIMTIMEDLLGREQEKKVVPAFIERCMEQHPEFEDWDKLYSKEEQLVRIVNYVLFNDTSYANYPVDALPPQLIEDYQNLLDSFLPQHPFVRNTFKDGQKQGYLDFTGPAFREYTLAKIILDEQYTDLGKMYFEESQSQSYFPSQIFFDCYREMSGGSIRSDHVAYVYDSFRAKAAAMERPYLQCSELPESDTEDRTYIAVFGMMTDKRSPKKADIVMNLTADDREMAFEQMTNVSVDTPSLSVKIGKAGQEARISNSSIICKEIVWATKTVTIESFNPEGCLLVAKEGISGEIPSIDIVRAENLRVSAPNINEFYRLFQYKYDFEDVTSFDIIKFIHALRCILVEFRTHKKDSLAKAAERIEFVTVGNSKGKRMVLDYLKATGIIYSSAHLYKIDEAKMQEKGIFFEALSRMDTVLLKPVHDDFCKWFSDCESEH